MNLYAVRDFFNMILDMNVNVFLGWVVLLLYVLPCTVGYFLGRAGFSFLGDTPSFSSKSHRDSSYRDDDFYRRQDLERKSAILRNRNDKGGGWF